MLWNFFLHICSMLIRGRGGGLTKKKTQQYFKSSTRLIQIWQHLAHSSKTLYFYIHWTVQDCKKSYVLYNKGVTTVGLEKKKEECRKSRGSDSKQSLDLNFNMTNTSFSFYRLLYHNFLVSHLFWCRRMPFKSKLPHIKILSVFIQLYNFLHWV